jgi:hypothetical protein
MQRPPPALPPAPTPASPDATPPRPSSPVADALCCDTRAVALCHRAPESCHVGKSHHPRCRVRKSHRPCHHVRKRIGPFAPPRGNFLSLLPAVARCIAPSHRLGATRHHDLAPSHLSFLVLLGGEKGEDEEELSAVGEVC